jgi:hypothetical protein
MKTDGRLPVMNGARRFALWLFLAAVWCETPGVAQSQPRGVLFQTVSREDWGLVDVRAIRFGQLVLVKSASGSSLYVRSLREEIPSQGPHRILGEVPDFAGSHLMVADFGNDNRTPLGGYFNTFVERPSVADASVERAADGRRALRFTCRRQASDFCGLSVQLYDSDATPAARRYLDARSFSALTFRIRGHAGDERLLLKVAGAEWELREDAVPIGEVAQFLPTGGVATTWQWAVVPLDRFPSEVRQQTLALLVLEAMSAGTTAIDLGPVAFSLNSSQPPPLPRAKTEEPTRQVAKATWIWNTSELLEDEGRQRSLLAFLEREGFDYVFLQLPGVPGEHGTPGEVAVDAATLRSLIAALNGLGIRVYALDGDPRYTLPQFHVGMLETVGNVISYNRQVRQSERFFGVRYDIEPYLLPGFDGPGRDSLLQDLLQVVAASVARAHAGGLTFGADIPFWYDEPAAFTQEPVTAEFDGAKKPMSEHIIDLVDDVSVMDYRTITYGGDGTIRHASGELAYAERLGKSVFVGLETEDLPDEVLLDFRGDPVTVMEQEMPEYPFVALWEDGDSVHVLLVEEDLEPDSTGSESRSSVARRWMERGGPWWRWTISGRTEIPSDKITFAAYGGRRLSLVMRQTAAELQRYQSFAGFAIHHAESYRHLRAVFYRPR